VAASERRADKKSIYGDLVTIKLKNGGRRRRRTWKSDRARPGHNKKGRDGQLLEETDGSREWWIKLIVSTNYDQ
jgi:hypothetical protein